MRRNRSEAVVIKDNTILVIFCKKENSEFYVLPGGGIEQDETPEECVIREVYEETTIKVTCNKLIFKYEISDDLDKYIFLCNYIEGQPSLGDANEKAEIINNSNIHYEPQWISIDMLKSIFIIYNVELIEWLVKNLNSIEKIDNPFILKITKNQQKGFRHK